jgi:hypothetical protein
LLKLLPNLTQNFFLYGFNIVILFPKSYAIWALRPFRPNKPCNCSKFFLIWYKLVLYQFLKFLLRFRGEFGRKHCAPTDAKLITGIVGAIRLLAPTVASLIKNGISLAIAPIASLFIVVNCQKNPVS